MRTEALRVTDQSTASQLLTNFPEARAECKSTPRGRVLEQRRGVIPVIIDLRPLQRAREIDVPNLGLGVELIDLPASFPVAVPGLLHSAARPLRLAINRRLFALRASCCQLVQRTGGTPTGPPRHALHTTTPPPSLPHVPLPNPSPYTTTAHSAHP